MLDEPSEESSDPEVDATLEEPEEAALDEFPEESSDPEVDATLEEDESLPLPPPRLEFPADEFTDVSD